jgi:hypothetical protein
MDTSRGLIEMAYKIKRKKKKSKYDVMKEEKKKGYVY